MLRIVCGLLLLLSVAWAQDDEMFGDSIITEVEEDTTSNPAEALLTAPLAIGGVFNLSAELGLNLSADEDQNLLSSGVADLSTTLYLDARPNSDFRFFSKGNLGYSTEEGLHFDLRELFADFDIEDRVYLRAGKQTVNWGVGYFFSPANLVNLERVDPENPEAELSGPIAIKAQVPLGNNNLSAYLLMNDLGEDNNLSFATRYEFLVEGYEITSGGIIEDNGHWAFMATGSGAIADVNVFAEVILEGNSKKVFIVEDSTAPLGLSTATSDSLFVSATFGARYSYTTEDELYSLSASAQYFFNGKGYADTSIFTDNPEKIAGLIGSGSVSIADLQERGQHYLAFNLSSPDVAKTNLTPSALWLANLSDGSGLVNTSLRYDGIDYLSPSLSYRYSYGSEGAEYTPNGESHSLVLALTISGSF